MISWLKEKMVWLVGAIIALITVYLFGRKDGKNAEKIKQNEKTINQISKVKYISDLSDDVIDRMPSKYD